MTEQEQASAVDTRAEPIAATDRFVSMDVLRGVAIFGILVMNIYAFAMPLAAYYNPLLLGGTDPLNMGVWFFTHLFFDQKFMAIFSMLYGAGIIMLWERAEARGRKVGWLFYRRSFWLMLFGLAHGIFIWIGDILFMYAVTGMLMFLFRKLSAKTLIIVAVFWLSIAPLLSAVSGPFMLKMQQQAIVAEETLAAGEDITDDQQAMLDDWNETRGFVSPTDEDVAKDLENYGQDYLSVIEYRKPLVVSFQIQGTLFFGIWRAGGMMLLGMALMKLGVLKAQRTSSFYKRMMLFGYGLGLPVMLFSAWNAASNEWDGIYMFAVGMTPNYVGSIGMALGHIGLVMLLVSTGRLSGLLTRFQAVGRMAFTNYLMHSIVLTTVFYGYGLGLYGEFPRIAQMGFVLAVIVLQLLVSPWWLSRFRFGPAEWLWRSLTYWRPQPMRTS